MSWTATSMHSAILLVAAARASEPATLAPEDAAQSPAPFADRLTGDWGGLRQNLAGQGVTLDLESTHYYQGLLDGSGDKSFEYGGRLDANLNLDAAKLGLWEGGEFGAHLEYRYGDLEPSMGGALLPMNLGMTLPQGAHEEVVASALYLSQQFGPNVYTRIGKINPVDLLAAHPFFGGAGTSRFMHAAFAAPPSGISPPAMLGAMATVKTDPFTWTLMVYDPDDHTDDYSPHDLFDEGVNVLASAAWGGKLAGRTTALTLTGALSTKDSIDLSDVLLPEDLRTGEKDGSYHFAVQVDHFLFEPPDRPGEGWGLFVKLGVSDGNPNPYEGWIAGGIGGRGLFAARPRDSFGVGYFFHGLSDDLQRVLEPLAEIDDEHGFEAFYSVAVTPWFDLTFDLQHIDPADAAADEALVGGLRARLRF